MKIFIILSVVVSIATARLVTFRDCGSIDGKIKTVDVNPCPNEPCHLVHGTNVSLTVEFESDLQNVYKHFDDAVDTTKATTKIHGIILGLPVPFPFSHADACAYHNVPCPIVHGTSYTYTNVLQVLNAYPKMSLVVKWELQIANSEDLFCFVMPAVITDS